MIVTGNAEIPDAEGPAYRADEQQPDSGTGGPVTAKDGAVQGTEIDEQRELGS